MPRQPLNAVRKTLPFVAVVLLLSWNAFSDDAARTAISTSDIVTDSARFATESGAQTEKNQPPEKSDELRLVSASMDENSESALRALKRPLDAVTLSNRAPITKSSEGTTKSGDALKTPDNLAAAANTNVARIIDASPAPVIRHPNRNLYPICHNPLYFEDPNMERCGQGFGIFTEAVSAVRFVGRVPLIPYMMAGQPPCSRVRALPDCPTCRRFDVEAYVPRPSVDAITLQSLATVGVIFLIP